MEASATISLPNLEGTTCSKAQQKLMRGNGSKQPFGLLGLTPYLTRFSLPTRELLSKQQTRGARGSIPACPHVVPTDLTLSCRY